MDTDHQVAPSLNLTRQRNGIAATEGLAQHGRPRVEGKISGENMPRITNSKNSLSGYRRPVDPKPNKSVCDIQLAGPDSLSRTGSPQGYRRWNANYTNNLNVISRVSEGLSSLTNHLFRSPWDRTAYALKRASGDGASIVADKAKGSSCNPSRSFHSSHKLDIPAPKKVRKGISVGA